MKEALSKLLIHYCLTLLSLFLFLHESAATCFLCFVCFVLSRLCCVMCNPAPSGGMIDRQAFPVDFRAVFKQSRMEYRWEQRDMKHKKGVIAFYATKNVSQFLYKNNKHIHTWLGSEDVGANMKGHVSIVVEYVQADDQEAAVAALTAEGIPLLNGMKNKLVRVWEVVPPWMPPAKGNIAGVALSIEERNIIAGRLQRVLCNDCRIPLGFCEAQHL